MLFLKCNKILKETRQALGDISEKMAELEKKNRSMKAIIKSMIEGIIVVDKDTNILAINHSAENIFGISKKDTEGKLLLEVIRNSDIADLANDVLKKGTYISKELLLTWPIDGIFIINASAIIESEGIIGCVLVVHDITELRKLELMRKDFVANVSHELKTPLTSIKGFIETLLEGALDDKENSRNFLKIIQNHASRLDNLLNDLLDLSYLESKEVVLKADKIKLKDLVDEILAGFKAQLKKKSINVKNEISPDLVIKADKDRFNQVLTNFIDNAVKFNKENGFIKIYSELSDSKIKIYIEDNGAGIPAKDLPRIFERFYRVDKARSRELGGTGLGLSIIKHIIELHKGEVGVESTEGAGSKFWFIIPK